MAAGCPKMEHSCSHLKEGRWFRVDVTEERPDLGWQRRAHWPAQGGAAKLALPAAFLIAWLAVLADPPAWLERC